MVLVFLSTRNDLPANRNTGWANFSTVYGGPPLCESVAKKQSISWAKKWMNILQSTWIFRILERKLCLYVCTGNTHAKRVCAMHPPLAGRRSILDLLQQNRTGWDDTDRWQINSKAMISNHFLIDFLCALNQIAFVCVFRSFSDKKVWSICPNKQLLVCSAIWTCQPKSVDLFIWFWTWHTNTHTHTHITFGLD